MVITRFHPFILCLFKISLLLPQIFTFSGSGIDLALRLIEAHLSLYQRQLLQALDPGLGRRQQQSRPGLDALAAGRAAGRPGRPLGYVTHSVVLGILAQIRAGRLGAFLLLREDDVQTLVTVLRAPESSTTRPGSQTAGHAALRPVGPVRGLARVFVFVLLAVK